MIEKIDLANFGLTPAQLELRKLGLGGSDAGRINRQLWLELTGRAKPEDLSGNLPVQLGTFTEPFNCAWYEKVTGREVTNRGQSVKSKTFPWMRANLDGITHNSKGYRSYCDFKHTGRADDVVIRRYIPQLTHCCTILQLDHWVLSVLVGNNKHEIFEGEVDIFYKEELIAREADFWGYVTRDEDPGDRFEEKPAVPAPTPQLRTIVVPTDGRDPAFDAIVRQENWLPEMLSQTSVFASTHAAAALHAITRERIKSLVPEDVGKVSYGLFTYKRDKRGQTLTLAKGETDE